MIQDSKGQNGAMNKPMGTQVALKGGCFICEGKEKLKMKGIGKIAYS
jgi:hypothetical protein